MADYDNTNRGTLGKNKRREKETQPEYKGKLNVDGVDYWLSGWVRESQGERFFSLSVQRKDPKPENVEADFRKEVEQTFGREQPSEDIPF